MTLSEFFKENPNVAVAFSGGVDSAYLLYAAMKYAQRVRAYYVKSVFQPQFELDDAKKLADILKADMKIIYADVLSDENIKKNPSDRCYYCKNKIFKSILHNAEKDGFSAVIDGTNASDSSQDRPGMRALTEMKVLSPLRLCGLDKEEIRRLSKEAGLFTHDKPAYACLATRIPTGTIITEEDLKRTEICEEKLFSMGYTDFRIRAMGDCARLQIKECQTEKLIAERKEITELLKPYYKSILLDLEAR